MITYEEKTHRLLLRTENTLYALKIGADGVLTSLYWGEDLPCAGDLPTDAELSRFCRHPYMSGRRIREEYPAFGGVCPLEPALKADLPDGVRDTELRYVSHEIDEEGRHLAVRMKDAYYGLFVRLDYRLYDGLDLIDKQATVENRCGAPVTVRKLSAGTVCLPENRSLRLSTMSSHWGREYDLQRETLTQKKYVVESRSLYANSDALPWFALDDGASEEHGEVWFGTLRWAGNHKITVEKTAIGLVSVTAGFNDFDFSYTLKDGETLSSPVFTVGYTKGGFGAASRMFHDFQRRYFAPRAWANKPLPIVYNAWAAMHFKITAKALLPQIDLAAKLGAELFVIDDGWFGNRDDDTSGLGDWYPNPQKFPEGLRPIAEKCHAAGMLFGVWIEPEMVSVDSDLYRAHPDWILGFPNREKEEFRHQLMLNVARDDVRDYMIACIDRLIGDNGLDYLKWDSNRFVSHPGWLGVPPEKQQEMWVRYIENMYAVFAFVRDKYPRVIVENCAAGGMRSELSLGAYCSRINRSDNQDPRDMLFLHEGFTQLHRSACAGGGCHIAKPQGGLNDRVSPLRFRAHAGMLGSLAVGFDLTKLSDDDFREIQGYLAFHKQIRETVQCGDLYRLVSPRETAGEYCVYEFVSRDKKEAVLFVFGVNISFYHAFPRVKLLGLLPDAVYEAAGETPRTGKALASLGVEINPLVGDYDSRVLVFRAK